MADTKLAKVGITLKERWMPDISFEALDFTLWRTQDGGDGRGYLAKQANIGVRPDSDDSVWLPATEAGSSIYDLAVKYGYEGTEAQFVEEYNAAVAAANAAAASASAVEAQVAAAEASRVSAENARVQAEAERQGAEQTRVNNEAERANNETARSNNEAGRVAAETDRATAESGRQTAEATRQSNETARENAEQERTADFEGLKTDMQTAIQQADAATAAADEINRTVQQNETARQQAESGRAAAETQRQTAETQRGTNESTRQTQETARQTAETSRQTAETTRGTNENARQTAEAARSSAENTRQSSEASRRTAETAREEQSTSDHQRAESDHAIAAEDHATLDEKISHKADIDGSYDSMAVGIAKNLEGRTNVTDSFFERTTGGDAEVANGTAQLNEVKGKSQVWNQLVAPNSASGGTSKNVTYSISAGKLLLQTTADGVDGIGTVNIAASWIRDSTLGIKQITGHLYYSPKTLPTGFWFSANAYTGGIALCSGTITTGLAGSSQNGQAWSLRATGGTKVLNQIECPIILFDLTLMFGAGNEPSTVEEFEAWLAENIGEQAYYPYNAGEVLNNRMTGVESIGFNLLDPATGKADIIGAYSDVYGNYYGITGTHGTLTFTDKMGNTETITPDEDGKFLLETAGTLSVADAGEDCAVFLWWDGTQTEYKQYEKNVGQLDVTHIYGKLNGEGEYVRVWPTGMPGIGDIKDSLKVVDGQVVAERKVGEVDMGTLAWRNTESLFYSNGLNGIIKEPSNTYERKTGLISSMYHPSVTLATATMDDMSMLRFAGSYNLYLKNNSKSAIPSQQDPWLSGILLYFELATPQVYTDLIYRDSESFADNTPVTLPVNYKVDNWGIERIAPQNTEEAVVTTKPELTMRYSIDAVEELNTHRDEIDDLYEKNEELDQRKPEKYGEYPDMAVGSAKTLAGQDTKVEDFFFKPIDCADGLAKLNSARGKSLVWNQGVNLSRINNFSVGGGTAVINGHDIEYTGDDSSTAKHTILTSRNMSMSCNAGDIILAIGYVKFSNYLPAGPAQYNGVRFSGVSIYGSPQVYVGVTELDVYQKSYHFAKALGDSTALIRIGYTDESFDASVRNLMFFNLTKMFGAGNEPATVEEFEAMFPMPYYDYNPGEIISNKTEEVKVVGFNQWDEEVEIGNIDTQTGMNNTMSNRWRSKNYIPVFPETDYYFLNTLASPSNVIYAFAYDANKNYIGCWNGSQWIAGNAILYFNNRVIRTPKGCRFLRIQNYSGASYQNNICINLSDPARNGEYEPYKTNSIGLNLPTLTGKLNGEGESVVVFPDGLKSAGSVYDEIVGNKAIKRVGAVDLGTLRWSAWSSSMPDTFYNVGNVSDSVRGLGSKDNLRNSKGYSKIIQMSSASADKTIMLNSTAHAENTLAVRDSAYTDAATFKSAMDGVLLYYELATPEEYILDAPLPDTFQAYKGGTIKQLPENTSVPTTAPMVMTVTYAIDAVGTLVGLPRNYVSKESLQAMLNAMQSAGIIASYTMTYNENTGKYDFTFVAPTNS